MRIARFIDAEGDVAYGRPVDMQHAHVMRGDLFDRHTFAERPVRVAKFLAPVDPPNVIAIGLNYKAHAEEQGLKTLPAEPLIFLKATTSVIGPGEPIVLPASAPNEVDFEAEIAVIIARRARKVSEAAALEHVLGYTIANDVSARDCQKVRDKQWARGKSFDTFCPLGPIVVTPDELDGNACPIRAVLNGRVMQESNTADMIFPIRHLVSYLSHQFTLLPGTVILTGTPPGVGFARKPPIFMRPGDNIAIEIDGIGRLENPVVADTEPS